MLMEYSKVYDVNTEF